MQWSGEEPAPFYFFHKAHTFALLAWLKDVIGWLFLEKT